ncbi:Excinuclease cho [Andreprevotia sp. IGB-42]|uniref:3'-5' exonuclease family protein n=1 Tax=Andreprevotia sp. IGB-42 TaxID=2497473 RepID=UPI001358CCEF|nr:3'-5' exonuclease family protein [Andreprevotia sp. IGB-42]KAF0811301.1 Excinuclease cho [Andreprevotia sp. IGB-42]
MDNRYFSEPLVLVDLETTGANAALDRITEIGIVQIDADGVRTWSSLVNPGRPIPPFIQQLTGIDDAMVADAPAFAALAAEVLGKLQGRVFVAHNARFDYGFLRNEFKRLGMPFRAHVLCTVKLSRLLYPNEFKHSLDALVARHGLVLEGERHRALTDAVLLQRFLDAAQKDHPAEAIQQAIAELIRQPSLPPALDPNLIDDLPEAPGVCAFYGAGNQALWVGKHGNLRKGVLALCNPGRKATAAQLQLPKEVQRIDWEQTPGELGALLLEVRWRKALRPSYNPQPRRDAAPCLLRLSEQQGVLLPQVCGFDDIEPGADGADFLFGPLRSKRDAGNLLGKLADGQGLCRQLLGLESRPANGGGACLAVALGKCRGACCGREPLATHNARVLMALSKHAFSRWPYAGAVGVSEGGSWAPQLHVLDQWIYLDTIADIADLPELLATPRPAFDYDIYKLIKSELTRLAGKVTLLT